MNFIQTLKSAILESLRDDKHKDFDSRFVHGGLYPGEFDSLTNFQKRSYLNMRLKDHLSKLQMHELDFMSEKDQIRYIDRIIQWNKALNKSEIELLKPLALKHFLSNIHKFASPVPNQFVDMADDRTRRLYFNKWGDLLE